MPFVFDESKPPIGGALPLGATHTIWQDYEPLITPALVKQRYLFGMPLVSATTNPFTRKPDILDDSILSDYIKQAVSTAEMELGIEIMGRPHAERHPYDRAAMQSFGYMVLEHRPVASIESLEIASTDGATIWKMPLSWIDTGYLVTGQINVLPMALVAQSGTISHNATSIGAGLVPSLLGYHWVPGFWTCRYTTGFINNQIPLILNQFIGIIAAMEVLSMLAATYARSQSSSLGIDGLSQSISTPGPELFSPRLRDLAEKRQTICSKVKHIFGVSLWADNV